MKIEIIIPNHNETVRLEVYPGNEAFFTAGSFINLDNGKHVKILHCVLDYETQKKYIIGEYVSDAIYQAWIGKYLPKVLG